jgi:hypothetical protein
MEKRLRILGVTETELSARKLKFLSKRFMKNCYMKFYENTEDNLDANAR